MVLLFISKISACVIAIQVFRNTTDGHARIISYSGSLAGLDSVVGAGKGSMGGGVGVGMGANEG